MSALREWLLGMCAAAMAVTLADCLIPEGAVKKIGRMIGGLVLMITALQPLVGLDYASISEAWASYRMENAGYSQALESENTQLIKIIMEEQAGAYIQDKAAELGVDCTVQVTCLISEDGTPYPAQAVIQGSLTQEQRERLQQLIEGDLAIPAEGQRYEEASEQ
ncbi:MAG: stage III sporulation protein AF [Oscillospiraceae bacterium]|nr:stage III sporulation protein AF [Oscillospiraceae bacterium]